MDSYSAFQISDGVAGQAEQEANAVFVGTLREFRRGVDADVEFVDPFAGVDLSTVDSATLDAIDTMREAAESAETDQFDPQIAAASGAAGV